MHPGRSRTVSESESGSDLNSDPSSDYLTAISLAFFGWRMRARSDISPSTRRLRTSASLLVMTKSSVCLCDHAHDLAL